MKFKFLITALDSGEDIMLKRLFKYASEAGYTLFTSTKEEEWRMTLRESTKALIQFLKTQNQPDSIHADEKFEENPTAKYGAFEARRHRKPGVKFDKFLGLTKLVRQVFIDIIENTKMTNPEQKQALAITHRFFDMFELGFCSEWLSYQEDDLNNYTKIIKDLNEESSIRKSLLDNLPCVALILKKGSREIVASNEAAKKIGAVPGKTCFEICAQRGDNCPFCLAPEVWEADEPRRLEVEYRGAFYEGIWIPLTEDLYAHYIYDITERKQAQDWLKFLSYITEQIADSMITTDLDFKITWVNRSFTTLYGYSQNEIFGQTPNFLNVEKQSVGIQNVIYKTVSSCQVWRGEVQNRKKDGTTFPAELMIFPLLDKDKKVFAYAGHQRDITERKYAEQALKDSEVKYSTLVEQSNDAVVYLQDEIFKFSNKAMTEISGYSNEELSTMNFLDVIAPECRELIKDRYEMRLAGKKVISTYELKILRKDGLTRDLEVSANIVQYEGKPATMGVLRDITERERAEEKIRENEEKYRTLFENMAQGAFYQKPDGILVNCNSALLEMFGLTRDQFLGRTSKDPRWKVIHEDGTDFPGDQHPSMEALRTGKPISGVVAGVFNLIKEDYVWLSINAIPQFKPGENKPFQVFVTLHDITELMQAEKALKESEEKYRLLVENANDGIEITQDDRIFFSNHRFAEMLGYTVDELNNINFSLIFSEQATHDLHERSKMRESNLPVPNYYETTFQKKNGAIIFVEVKYEIISYKGKPATFAIIRDITDRKEAEKQIKNQNTLLEKAVQDKQKEMEILMERLIRQEKLATVGQMSGSIAHELRNPLSVMRQSMFFLNHLHEKNKLGSSGSKVKEHIEIVMKEIDGSDEVISDLLQMTRMDRMEKKHTDLHSVISEVLNRIPLGKNTRLKIDLKPEPFLIWADPLQMRQVLTNLLSNATQAIQTDGIIKISAKMEKKNKKYLIKIQDNGPSITSENLNKVFEPLYTTKAKGIGLGLSICKQIIENHGGTITMTSEAGKGTIVNIQLPANNSDPNMHLN